MKAVYTLEDLSSRSLLDAGAEKPARLAVIGHPIAHSASPQMHQPALDAAGVDARYIRIDIEPGRVAEAFARMRELGFVGCNVTVPHKLEAMGLCEVDDAAKLLGAVNTVVFQDGAPRGYNTDGPGFMRAVEEAFGVPLSELRVGVIGAGGGAGQAISMQCHLAGVKGLLLVNRTVSKLGAIVAAMGEGGKRVVMAGMEDPQLAELCRGCDLLVNTTSVGLKAGDPPVLPEGCVIAGQKVYDTIYQPAVTPLLAMAREAGCETANGLSMLIHQGALASQHWFPGSDPLAVMSEVMRGRAG